MKGLTSFIILVGAGVPLLCCAQTPAASSAPIQVTSGALQVSSAPVQIALAAPRAAPVAPPSDIPATQNVLPGPVPENHGSLHGYRREVRNGEERYCRNDVATGSHVARNLTCLTYAQMQAEERRAQQFIEAAQRMGGYGNTGGTASQGGIMGGR